MAKNLTWVWRIIKSSHKQSGYLMVVHVEGADASDPQVAEDGLDDLSGFTTAWTTLAAAKRHAAKCMGRSRVKWSESGSDTNMDGERDDVGFLRCQSWESRIEPSRAGRTDLPGQ